MLQGTIGSFLRNIAAFTWIRAGTFWVARSARHPKCPKEIESGYIVALLSGITVVQINIIMWRGAINLPFCAIVMLLCARAIAQSKIVVILNAMELAVI
ncbi:MAG: hypothetical protein KME15_13285 [Drouetiella hepatica Uher 2000/2452]|jgi:hypothetical protein|uniref:Uncharacterized protein n=1 Tax=Drouetiella hepatica Uher 2000/2452 TaxID=904376 RepID=A0A951QDZ4_9CYAN|nr:hypothetical protein [Drouetiella hepatica Uher 2000/2452]